MASAGKPAIAGIFDSHTQAEEAIRELRGAGFRDSELRMAGKGGTGGPATSGTLSGLGLNDEETRQYEEALRAGRTVVTVRAESDQDSARSILKGRGAHEVTGPGPDPTVSYESGASGNPNVPDAQPDISADDGTGEDKESGRPGALRDDSATRVPEQDPELPESRHSLQNVEGGDPGVTREIGGEGAPG